MSAEAYVHAIQELEGELDTVVTQHRRIEQRYLRQSLFGDRPLGLCALCGRELPVNLLVAAHIKKRASCTRAEKLDVGNIVMAACKLGCDDLYEHGYITVNGRGLVIATSVRVPEDVAATLEVLEGRACGAFTQGSSEYFKAHQLEAFLDRRERRSG